VTTAERDALLQRTIDEIPAEIEAYDEQSQSKTQALKRGRAAKRRQITRLKRRSKPDTLRGKHAVARAWLRTMSQTFASL
jgi:hypothetical protein